MTRLLLALAAAAILVAIASGAAQRRHPRRTDIRQRTYAGGPGQGWVRYVREWPCVCGEPVFVG